MDPLLLVAVLAGVVLGVAAIFWYRKRQAQQERIRLQQAATDLLRIEASLKSFGDNANFIAERIRRSFESKATEISEKVRPRTARLVTGLRHA